MIKESGIVLAIVILLWTTPHLEAAVDIAPRLSAGVVYTDNLFLSNDNAGSEAESEWITTVTPGIDLKITGRTTDLSINYDPTYNKYEKYSEGDYWRHLAHLLGQWQTTRHLHMEIEHFYLRTEEQIDEEDLTTRGSREPYTRNTSMLQIDYQLSEDNSISFQSTYDRLENEDPDAQDSDRFGGSMGIVYWFNKMWGIDLGGQFYRQKYGELDDYDHTVGRIRLNHRFSQHFTGFLGYTHTWYQFDEDPNDYQIYDGSIGFDYLLDQSLDLTVEVHYFIRDFDVAQDESEILGNLNLNKQFQRGSFGFRLEGGYDHTAVNLENLGYYLYYGVVATGAYEFNRYVSGDIDTGWTYRDYMDEIPRREDDVIRAGCGLSFQIYRWLSARLGYTYRSVESNIEANDYIENRATLLFTIVPQRSEQNGND